MRGRRRKTTGYKRRRCMLLEELKEAAIYGDGSPVKAWTPNGGKVGRKKVGGEVKAIAKEVERVMG